MPLRFKRSLCTGCRLCELACSAVHEKVFNPEKSRIRIIHEYTDTEKGIKINANYCIFCGKCEEVCPTNAITNNGKWMIVNFDLCDGCGKCVEICPTNAIYLNKDNKAIICDLCGGSPKCVEWCPKGAIILKEEKVEVKA